MKYEITKEQILENYKYALNNQDYLSARNLKEWFPDAFKTELEVGKWYKSSSGMLFLFNGKYSRDGDSGSYGFNTKCDWRKNIGVALDGHTIYTEATPEEVEAALINEAKKRGFEKDIAITWSDTPDLHYTLNDGSLKYEQNPIRLMFGDYAVMVKGLWATIIPQEKTIVPMEKALKIIAKKMKVSLENIEIQ